MGTGFSKLCCDERTNEATNESQPGKILNGSLTFDRKSKINAGKAKVCRLTSYEGDYFMRDGVECFHGKGKANYQNEFTYEGEWAFGNFNGQGTLFEEEDYYKQGEFKNNLLNGEGVINNEVAIFKGTFKDNKLNGHCTIKYHVDKNDKNEYKKSEIEGYFKDGKAYGEIKLTLVNGGEYKGNYKYGKCIQATFRSSTGKLVERKYENGKAIKKEDLDFGDFMERIRTKRLENV